MYFIAYDLLTILILWSKCNNVYLLVYVNGQCKLHKKI